MEKLETQRKVREIYLNFVDDGKLIPIDGNKTKIRVEKNILSLIMKHLSNY